MPCAVRNHGCRTVQPELAVNRHEIPQQRRHRIKHHGSCGSGVSQRRLIRARAAAEQTIVGSSTGRQNVHALSDLLQQEAQPPDQRRWEWARRIPLRVFTWLQSLQRERSHPALEGAYAPVDTEVYTEDLRVEGTIPAELDGMYIRTGPNPHRPPHGGYHWFDGDAMVHAITFSNGQALSYHNHLLRTPRLLAEANESVDAEPRVGDLRGIKGLLIMAVHTVFQRLFPGGVRQLPERAQLGNTALVFFNNRLLALQESGFPFELRARQGVVSSCGPYNFDGQLQTSMTAHPKTDPDTGIMHFFTTQLTAQQGQWITYQTVSPAGEVSKPYPVDVRAPQLMHDFAITERFLVFMDANLWFDPAAMVKHGSLPFVPQREAACRIGLMRKDAPERGVAHWFDVPSFFAMHTISAWEEGEDTVCFTAASCDSLDMSLGGDKMMAVYAGPYAMHYTLQLSTGKVDVRRLSPVKCDLAGLALPRLGKKQQYAYMVLFEEHPGHTSSRGALSLQSDKPFAYGLVKMDLTAEEDQGAVTQLMMPKHETVGEPLFVPRDAAAMKQGSCAIDDGYLVSYVSNIMTGASYCAIWDAATMAPEPLAKVHMPQRVPVGFHATFVTADELALQAA